jgi:hypothetical protein
MKPKPQIKRGMTNNRTITNKYRKHKELKADIATSPSQISLNNNKKKKDIPPQANTRQNTNPNR